MPALPKRKLSHGRKRRKAFSKKAQVPSFVKCPHCGAQKIPHRACPDCGKL